MQIFLSNCVSSAYPRLVIEYLSYRCVLFHSSTISDESLNEFYMCMSTGWYVGARRCSGRIYSNYTSRSARDFSNLAFVPFVTSTKFHLDRFPLQKKKKERKRTFPILERFDLYLWFTATVNESTWDRKGTRIMLCGVQGKVRMGLY